jgi:transcription initiation factor TFIIIB Brf1 subunit/transcription initiation factor TFIIB
METADAILKVMDKEGTPLNAGKIAELTGIDRKEVDKAMAKLKKERKIVSPKRCYWEPAAS